MIKYSYATGLLLLCGILSGCGDPTSKDVLLVVNSDLGLENCNNVNIVNLEIKNIVPGIDGNHKRVEFNSNVNFHGKNLNFKDAIFKNNELLKNQLVALSERYEKDKKAAKDPMLHYLINSTYNVSIENLTNDSNLKKIKDVEAVYKAGCSRDVAIKLLKEIIRINNKNEVNDLDPLTIKHSGNYNMVKSSSGWILNKY